jgi:hypothetical protein
MAAMRLTAGPGPTRFFDRTRLETEPSEETWLRVSDAFVFDVIGRRLIAQ